MYLVLSEAVQHKESTMNFVLIPGAWMDAWESVARGLRALGYRVHPVTLSGLARNADVSEVRLETHVEDVLSVLEAGDLRDVVVVGHSFSGLVAGQVADRTPDRVAHTVFVDAFLPHDEKSMLDAFSEHQREDELGQIAENRGRWPASGRHHRRSGQAWSVHGAGTVAGGAFRRASGAHGIRTGCPEPAAGGAAGDLHRVLVPGLGRCRGDMQGAKLDLTQARHRPLADGVGSRRARRAARRSRVGTRLTGQCVRPSPPAVAPFIVVPPYACGLPRRSKSAWAKPCRGPKQGSRRYFLKSELAQYEGI